MIISKTIEWDMGHRIPNHKSKCKNLHGHRYKAEIILQGELINSEGASNEGMVMDFSDIKKIAQKFVEEPLDHSFMFYDKDKILLKFFESNPIFKSIPVPFIPTAENIAEWMFKIVESKLNNKQKTNLKLSAVKLWETPNSYVIYKDKEGQLAQW